MTARQVCNVAEAALMEGRSDVERARLRAILETPIDDGPRADGERRQVPRSIGVGTFLRTMQAMG